MHEALNHAKLAMLFRKEFELCNARKGETVEQRTCQGLFAYMKCLREIAGRRIGLVQPHQNVNLELVPITH